MDRRGLQSDTIREDNSHTTALVLTKGMQAYFTDRLIIKLSLVFILILCTHMYTCTRQESNRTVYRHQARCVENGIDTRPLSYAYELCPASLSCDSAS